MVYDRLARHYDLLLGSDDRWARRARKACLGPLLAQIGSVCDLACGTGKTLLEFAKQGKRLAGVDLSPAMCAITRRKLRTAGYHAGILCADMREFRLPEKVDLITCEFDAINHIPRRADLSHVCGAVARALQPGGWFYFDANNQLAFERMWQTTWALEQDGVFIVFRGQHKPGTREASSQIDFFERSGRSWRRTTERVDEVCWSLTEVKRALQAKGLALKQYWDAAPFFRSPAVGPGHRTIYLAQKT